MDVSLACGPLCRLIDDAGTDASERSRGVASWRETLNESLRGKLREPLEWDDDSEHDVVATDLSRAGRDGLRLLAIYADRPELDLPDRIPRSLELDPFWNQAEREQFRKSRYGHLLAARVWLPGDFEITFHCPGPDGVERTFGSLTVLSDQLRWLNERTIQAPVAAFEAWCAAGLSEPDDFVAAARFGLAAASTMTAAAVRRGLPLMVRESDA